MLLDSRPPSLFTTNIEYSSRSRADLSRKLGWKPTRTRGDFFETFEEEVKTIAAEFD